MKLKIREPRPPLRGPLPDQPPLSLKVEPARQDEISQDGEESYFAKDWLGSLAVQAVEIKKRLHP